MTKPPPPACAHCGEDRLIERIGAVILCAVCARQTRLVTPPKPREDAPGRAIGARREGQDDPR
jgi:hypothetical protein